MVEGIKESLGDMQSAGGELANGGVAELHMLAEITFMHVILLIHTHFPMLQSSKQKPTACAAAVVEFVHSLLNLGIEHSDGEYRAVRTGGTNADGSKNSTSFQPGARSLLSMVNMSGIRFLLRTFLKVLNESYCWKEDKALLERVNLATVLVMQDVSRTSNTMIYQILMSFALVPKTKSTNPGMSGRTPMVDATGKSPLAMIDNAVSSNNTVGNAAAIKLDEPQSIFVQNLMTLYTMTFTHGKHNRDLNGGENNHQVMGRVSNANAFGGAIIYDGCNGNFVESLEFILSCTMGSYISESLLMKCFKKLNKTVRQVDFSLLFVDFAKNCILRNLQGGALEKACKNAMLILEGIIAASNNAGGAEGEQILEKVTKDFRQVMGVIERRMDNIGTQHPEYEQLVRLRLLLDGFMSQVPH